MRVAHWVWGLGFLTAGTLLALRMENADGPRIGLVMVLLTLGLLILGVPLVQWFLRKTTRPEDYEGACPVGRVCPGCETFNFNPRNTCKNCRADLTGVPPAGSEKQAL